jgi:ribosome-binding protein aMBF1 (putative translation factor)
MTKNELELYWSSIPIGKDYALTYTELCISWNCNERRARSILHDLSLYDSGDDFILIRSARNKGFYRTDDEAEMKAYKRECLAKGRSIFAPIKKINRVLNEDDVQYSFTNNLRVVRERCGLTQTEVCERMNDIGLDKFLLSKMENNICFPTDYQLRRLAQIYGCTAHELIDRSICLTEA